MSAGICGVRAIFRASPSSFPFLDHFSFTNGVVHSSAGVSWCAVASKPLVKPVNVFSLPLGPFLRLGQISLLGVLSSPRSFAEEFFA